MSWGGGADAPSGSESQARSAGHCEKSSSRPHGASKLEGTAEIAVTALGARKRQGVNAGRELPIGQTATDSSRRIGRGVEETLLGGADPRPASLSEIAIADNPRTPATTSAPTGGKRSPRSRSSSRRAGERSSLHHGLRTRAPASRPPTTTKHRPAGECRDGNHRQRRYTTAPIDRGAGGDRAHDRRTLAQNTWTKSRPARGRTRPHARRRARD